MCADSVPMMEVSCVTNEAYNYETSGVPADMVRGAC